MIVANLKDRGFAKRLRPLERPAVFLGLLPLMVLLVGCTKTLNVQVAGVGVGGVTSSPAGISCGAGGVACADTTRQGTAVTLTAAPSSGSVFAGWAGACSGSGTSCSVTLDGDMTVFAYFRTTQVSTGAYHTCALKMNGTVECWGRNNEGQLGRGTTQNAGNDYPVAVSNLTNAVAVAAGGYHTCILLVGGSVQCWGRNTEGQVGDASGADPISAPTPIRTFATVPGVAIAAGGYHSCELMSDATVMCWGYNHDQQITAGTFGSTYTALPVAGVAGAVAVTAGAYHSCALLGNGSADCWGYNHDGETGTSSGVFNTIAISARQLDAATGAGVQGTTAQGGYHTCALLTNGSVSCWGYNGHGELGNGTSSGPQPVGTAVTANLPASASSVAAGGYHTCAIVGGAVMCWGADESAQLGRGTSSGDLLLPGVISGTPPPALSIDAGGYHTCAVFSGAPDDVRCWGRNTEGQVGRNSNNFPVDPVTIPMKPLGF
jgi:alpha-tubulin suppressor-like RCC1 family protein